MKFKDLPVGGIFTIPSHKQQTVWVKALFWKTPGRIAKSKLHDKSFTWKATNEELEVIEYELNH